MTPTDDIIAAVRRGGTIDMTTTGARSGQPRRIEIDLFGIDGRSWISGSPGRRHWMANLKADPRLTIHLKRVIRADLPATARIVTDPHERRPVLEHVTAAWHLEHQLDAFVALSPLIEVTFDDPALRDHRAA